MSLLIGIFTFLLFSYGLVWLFTPNKNEPDTNPFS